MTTDAQPNALAVPAREKSARRGLEATPNSSAASDRSCDRNNETVPDINGRLPPLSSVLGVK